MLSDMKKSIAGRVKVEDDVVYFESLDLVDSFINPTRAKIIQAVKTHKPKSIYELSKILKMDQGYIQKEVQFLEGLGVLAIETVKEGGRQKSVPRVLFDRFVIDIHQAIAI
jgi:predicted transcriptional regulator